MNSDLPKVLHLIGGRPMLSHLLESACELDPGGVHVVIGSGADQVREACSGFDVNWVVQADQKGTGHAVAQAMPGIPDNAAVLVLLADHPLIPVAVLRELAGQDEAALTVLTMELDKPKGYGRIVRDRTGRITKVVEDGDATPAQWAIREVNSGIILAAAGRLRNWLDRLGCDNRKGEYYLTDIFSMAHQEGCEIVGVVAPDSRDLQGANDRRQLAKLEDRYRHNLTGKLMKQGVQIIDPRRVDIRGRLRAGRDVCLDINVVLEGEVDLGDGVYVEPGCIIRNSRLAAGTVVRAHSVVDGVETTGACEIGPFARLRAGTVLATGSRVGNFVEVKNSHLGADSKANHLSYLGDSRIGAGVNVGAGTITCNYDGANKHKTIIEDGASIGSGTQLVAPVTVGKNATIGAGSTITRDAPANELTTSRVKQTQVPDWKRPQKANTQAED